MTFSIISGSSCKIQFHSGYYWKGYVAIRFYIWIEYFILKWFVYRAIRNVHNYFAQLWKLIPWQYNVSLICTPHHLMCQCQCSGGNARYLHIVSAFLCWSLKTSGVFFLVRLCFCVFLFFLSQPTKSILRGKVFNPIKLFRSPAESWWYALLIASTHVHLLLIS